jgi:hypothetical protein
MKIGKTHRSPLPLLHPLPLLVPSLAQPPPDPVPPPQPHLALLLQSADLEAVSSLWPLALLLSSRAFEKILATFIWNLEGQPLKHAEYQDIPAFAKKLGESLCVVKCNIKLMHNSKIDRFALPVDCVVLWSGNPLAVATDTSPISDFE